MSAVAVDPDAVAAGLQETTRAQGLPVVADPSVLRHVGVLAGGVPARSRAPRAPAPRTRAQDALPTATT